MFAKTMYTVAQQMGETADMVVRQLLVHCECTTSLCRLRFRRSVNPRSLEVHFTNVRFAAQCGASHQDTARTCDVTILTRNLLHAVVTSDAADEQKRDDKTSIHSLRRGLRNHTIRFRNPLWYFMSDGHGRFNPRKYNHSFACLKYGSEFGGLSSFFK